MDNKQRVALLRLLQGNPDITGTGFERSVANDKSAPLGVMPSPSAIPSAPMPEKLGSSPLPATLSPFTADVSKLTPAEMVALDYHRRMLLQNLAQKNADGSMTTFRGAVVGTPEGETYLPTYWHGEVRDVPQAMRFMAKSGLKFPSYKTVAEALAAEKRMHAIMESDVNDFAKRK